MNVLQSVDFRDTAYWYNAKPDIREKLLFFREMLRVCLHPSLTNRTAGDILQTMQESLRTKHVAHLTQTPLFADAQGILIPPDDEHASANLPTAPRLQLPFQLHESDMLFVNTLPCQGVSNVKIVCNSASDYVTTAIGLSAEELPNIGLVDIAASPLLRYELTQPDLFRPLAANESLVRQMIARKYSLIVAELPRKRHLAPSLYAEGDFWSVWLRALERLLTRQGTIALVAKDKLLTDAKFQSLRAYLLTRFGTIRIYWTGLDEKILLTLGYEGKNRHFYFHDNPQPEKIIVTNGGQWLAASEQAFFEGMPLDDALLCNYQLQSTEDCLLLRFDEPPQDLAAIITDSALHFFQSRYNFEEQHEQERAQLAELARLLTDTEELLHCRLHPDLGQELRRWVQWAESKEAAQLVKKIKKPDYTLSKQFLQAARIFTDIHRKFDRLGEKAAFDKESLSVLRQWFEHRTEAVAALEAFFARPDFDAPAYVITKTDVFYYIFALLQSREYYANAKFLLRRMPPRIYATDDFRALAQTGSLLWKQATQST